MRFKSGVCGRYAVRGGCEALECSRIIYAWKSTWGLDADRRGKFLRMFGTEGSTAEAD